jgi:chemotaxis protein methyltransferase CheR
MGGLTPQLHAVLSAFLRERLGLHYRPDDLGLIEDRVSTVAVDAGFDSVLDYYYHLRYDDHEGAGLARLAEALVVHESYLFREFDALRMLVSRVVAPAVARGERPVIWSAACAGGEEPASLAMLLDQRGLLGATELHASDLSARVLAKAQANRWSSRGVRDVPDPALAERYVRIAADGSVSVEPALLAAIQWRRLNLIDPAQVAAMPLCDAILCRNVLIYFDDDGVRTVVASLAERLRPAGLLVVGVSESLLRFSTALRCEEIDGVFCYRRPA